MKAKHNLEHQVFRFLKQWGLVKSHLVVGVSGGSDSMALLRILLQIHPSELLHPVYVHHGDHSKNAKYRSNAEKFCLKQCNNLNLDLHILKNHKNNLQLEICANNQSPTSSDNTQESESEAKLRKVRYSLMQEYMESKAWNSLMLAHHADDLLETRLIRLIRGTGLQGLGAMKEKIEKSPSFHLYRPLLECSKLSLIEYLQYKNQEYIEDPSNKENSYLRNWIRNHWLQDLEIYRPGSVKSMSRSLQQVLNQRISGLDSNAQQEFSRSLFKKMNQKEQTEFLAQIIRSLNIQNYSSGQIKELQKRLSTPRKNVHFNMGKNLAVVLDKENIRIIQNNTHT